MSVIQEGDQLVLDYNNGEKYFFAVAGTTSIKPKKGIVLDSSQLIGTHYGAFYTVDTGSFVLADPCADILDMFGLQSDAGASGAQSGVERDNRHLASAAANVQSLTMEQISELKERGSGGRAIISSLIDSSATFDSKTEYSQEKYLKRKRAKYLPTMQVLRPSARTVCTAYYTSLPDKINHVRPEVFAYLLTVGNVRAGARVAVAGGCSGAMCGAVLERLGSDERALLLHGGARPPSRNLLKHYGRDAAERLDCAPIGSDAARDWAAAQGGLDALLVVGRLDPRPTLLLTLPLLKPSAPFAVHCHFAEPLADIQTHLLRTRAAVNIDLTSTFHRVHQVMPNRTHPAMRMDNASGFVLSGITILPAAGRSGSANATATTANDDGDNDDNTPTPLPAQSATSELPASKRAKVDDE